MTILDLVGNTPIVELNRINPNPNVKIYGKLEGHNPGGSVKDRAAYSMIKGAVERGEIEPDMKLIEATSGNTGIALAMIARLYNLEIELVDYDSRSRYPNLPHESMHFTRPELRIKNMNHEQREALVQHFQTIESNFDVYSES